MSYDELIHEERKVRNQSKIRKLESIRTQVSASLASLRELYAPHEEELLIAKHNLISTKALLTQQINKLGE